MLFIISTFNMNKKVKLKNKLFKDYYSTILTLLILNFLLCNHI